VKVFAIVPAKISACLHSIFEKLGWVAKIRWPRPERRARKLRPDAPSGPESPSRADIEGELRRSPEKRWSGTDTWS
jgi:stearoyl-CoA desaturase (Delta-9 desaturase)